MANYIISDLELTAIADAIRTKSGSSGTMTVEEMPTKISNIQGSGGSAQVNLQTKTVTPTTSQQNVTPDSGYDGLSKVTVNAMPTATQATPSVSINSSGLITASATQTAGYVSAGTKSATKQLTTQAAKTVTPTKSSQTAVASGVYTTGAVTVGAIPSEYIVPSGTKTITTNGTYDISSFASATVSVAVGSSSGGSYTGDLYSYGTATATPASGATSAQFTNIPKQPDFFICYVDTFNVESYHRAGVVVYDGETVYGQEIYSGTDDCYFRENTNDASSYYYKFSYSGTTLTISSSGTNNGGYFHNPGVYTLIYAYKDNENGTVAIDKKKVSLASTDDNIIFNEVAGEPVWYSTILRGNHDAQSASFSTVMYISETGYTAMSNASSASYTYTANTPIYSYENNTLNITSPNANFAAKEYSLIYAYVPNLGGIQLDVDDSGLITATSGDEVATKQLATQAGKTITPTTSTQTAIAKGTYATGAVTVGAIPSQYIIPSGTKNITTNGTYDMTSFASAVVNVANSSSGDSSSSGGYTGDLYSFGTATATPASGATSAQFTNIPKQPDFFICYVDTFNVESYHRAGVVVYDGETVYGQEIYSGTDDCYFKENTNSASSYTYKFSYSGTTLTVSAAGTNNGGYFHNPGTYTLIYAYKDNENGTVAIDKKKVTATASSSLSFNDVQGEPIWYSTILRSNHDAQSASSSTAVYVNESGCTRMSNANSASYTYTAGTGNYSYNNNTLTITPGNANFAAKEYSLIYAYIPDFGPVNVETCKLKFNVHADHRIENIAYTSVINGKIVGVNKNVSGTTAEVDCLKGSIVGVEFLDGGAYRRHTGVEELFCSSGIYVYKLDSEATTATITVDYMSDLA